MTAEEILTENQLFGLGENMKGIKKHEIIKAMKEYARLQIEQDRLQIIEKCALTLSSEYIIKELPIQLD